MKPYINVYSLNHFFLYLIKLCFISYFSFSTVYYSRQPQFNTFSHETWSKNMIYSRAEIARRMHAWIESKYLRKDFLDSTRFFNRQMEEISGGAFAQMCRDYKRIYGFSWMYVVFSERTMASKPLLQNHPLWVKKFFDLGTEKEPGPDWNHLEMTVNMLA